jgi:hypothetical protein
VRFTPGIAHCSRGNTLRIGDDDATEWRECSGRTPACLSPTCTGLATTGQPDNCSPVALSLIRLGLYH